MTAPPVHLVEDCALLPGKDGYVVYLGCRQRGFWVQPHVGQWLLRGAPFGAGAVSDAERDRLLEMGALAAGPASGRLSLNSLAPKGVAGWATLSLLVLVALTAWTLVLPGWSEGLAILLGGLGTWTTWLVVPVAAIVLTLAHEWGHMVALSVIGGRAGRLHLRFGWPWAVTVVGPFQSVLTTGQQLLLVAGGVLLELALLGLVLVCLKAVGHHPILTGVAVTEAVYLVFNLFPTPWSDGGQMVLIAYRGVLRLIGRGQAND